MYLPITKAHYATCHILIVVYNNFISKGMINLADRTRLMIVLKSRPDDETAAVFEFAIQRKVGQWGRVFDALAYILSYSSTYLSLRELAVVRSQLHQSLLINKRGRV